MPKLQIIEEPVVTCNSKHPEMTVTVTSTIVWLYTDKGNNKIFKSVLL